MVSILSGQSVSLWGQASQVASCFSHSAGMEKPSSDGVSFLSALRIKLARRLSFFADLSTFHVTIACLYGEKSLIVCCPQLCYCVKSKLRTRGQDRRKEII